MLNGNAGGAGMLSQREGGMDAASLQQQQIPDFQGGGYGMLGPLAQGGGRPSSAAAAASLQQRSDFVARSQSLPIPNGVQGARHHHNPGSAGGSHSGGNSGLDGFVRSAGGGVAQISLGVNVATSGAGNVGLSASMGMGIGVSAAAAAAAAAAANSGGGGYDDVVAMMEKVGMMDKVNTLDLTSSSDFPSLGFAHSESGSQESHSVGTSDPYSLQFGMLRRKHSAQNGEFSIQNEEFPALGGQAPAAAPSQGGGGGSKEEEGSSLVGSSGSSAASQAQAFFQRYGHVMPQVPNAGMVPPPPPKAGESPPPGGAISGHPAAMRFGNAPPHPKQHASPKQQQARAPASAKQSNGPAGAGLVGTHERFGLLGLLGVIRMNNVDLTTLALGTDLTTLGLNLNSPDSLYKSFTSPWSESQGGGMGGVGGGGGGVGGGGGGGMGGFGMGEHVKVPACYQLVTPPLQPAQIKSFPLETLFYMFYSMVMDEGQLMAADELWSRGWCYHREHKLWLARVPNTEPVVKTERYERGSFLVFDSMAWDIVRKDNFVLYYQALEQQSSVSQRQQQAQQVGGQQQQPKA